MSEIDIFEVFAHTNRLNWCLHKWGRSAKTRKNAHVMTPGGENDRKYVFASPGTPNGEFHVYGLEWTPAALAFYIDGEKYAECPIGEGCDYVRKADADLLPGLAGHHDFHYSARCPGMIPLGVGGMDRKILLDGGNFQSSPVAG